MPTWEIIQHEDIATAFEFDETKKSKDGGLSLPQQASAGTLGGSTEGAGAVQVHNKLWIWIDLDWGLGGDETTKLDFPRSLEAMRIFASNAAIGLRSLQ
jgi:hypothetical protein